MAGILGIYGLIVAVILNGKGKLRRKLHIKPSDYYLIKDFKDPNKSEEEKTSRLIK